MVIMDEFIIDKFQEFTESEIKLIKRRKNGLVNIFIRYFDADPFYLWQSTDHLFIFCPSRVNGKLKSFLVGCGPAIEELYCLININLTRDIFNKDNFELRVVNRLEDYYSIPSYCAYGTGFTKVKDPSCVYSKFNGAISLEKVKKRNAEYERVNMLY